MRLVRPVNWVSESRFVVDGLEFFGEHSAFDQMTTPERVVIVKEARLLRQYLEFLAPQQIDNMLELGIWQGGSPLFYGLATDVKKVVALDLISDEPAPDIPGQDPSVKFRHRNPAIGQIIERHGLGDKVKLHFGVSQDDREAVGRIIDTEFGDTPLDLVIDDASHLYEASKTSFELIFPRLRPGGLYIIEDWHWAHFDNEHYQNGAVFRGKPALTNLIFELIIAYGSHADLFWNLIVRDWYVAVQRGPNPLPADFRLDDMMRMRGKELALI